MCCTHSQMHTCTHTHTRIPTHARAHTHTHAHIHTRLHVPAHALTHTRMHMHMSSLADYTNTHRHTRTHTHIHTHQQGLFGASKHRCSTQPHSDLGGDPLLLRIKPQLQATHSQRRRHGVSGRHSSFTAQSAAVSFACRPAVSPTCKPAVLQQRHRLGHTSSLGQPDPS